MNYSMISSEGNIKSLQTVAASIAENTQFRIISEPSASVLTFKHHSPQGHSFCFIEEIPITHCVVNIDENFGYGCVTGAEPERALYMAMIDALFKGDRSICEDIKRLLSQEEKCIHQKSGTGKTSVGKNG